VEIVQDTINLYKGSHRIAPAAEAVLTYPAERFSMSAQFTGSDTSFTWSDVLVIRVNATHSAIPEPIWTSAVRSGVGDNEWTSIHYFQSPLRVEFHSSIYGDGFHEIESEAIPEELLWLLAVRLLEHPQELQLRVMASQWEQPYVRRLFGVKASVTGQHLKIDEVDATLVRFERDDGAVSEVWISSQGFRFLRMKTFRGMWLERIQ
jgi:hypothetical protein